MTSPFNRRDGTPSIFAADLKFASKKPGPVVPVANHPLRLGGTIHTATVRPADKTAKLKKASI